MADSACASNALRPPAYRPTPLLSSSMPGSTPISTRAPTWTRQAMWTQALAWTRPATWTRALTRTPPAMSTPATPNSATLIRASTHRTRTTRPPATRARSDRCPTAGARPGSTLGEELKEERDDEREQDERLNQREPENHRRLNTRCRAGVARDPLEGCGRRAPLAKGAAEHAEPDRNARARSGPRPDIERVRARVVVLRVRQERRHEGRGERERRQSELLRDRHRQWLLLRLQVGDSSGLVVAFSPAGQAYPHPCSSCSVAS